MIMLMPSKNVFHDIFGENLFDGLMDSPFEEEWFGKRNPLYGKRAGRMMKTDVREKKDSYEVMIDLPGFDKDEINVQLDNGYLTISAAKGLDKDEKAKDGQFIRRERYAGAMSRSFFVGEEVTREEIKAKYKNGILKLDIPKKEPENREKNSYIAIEG